MRLNPGDNAPETAMYSVVDENGRVLDRVEVEKGNRLPPTQSSSYHYELDK